MIHMVFKLEQSQSSLISLSDVRRAVENHPLGALRRGCD